MGWFSFVDISLDVPSSACMLKDTNFYDRLLFYVLAPVGTLVIMVLPSCWARWRKHPACSDVLSAFISTAFWLLFVIFPTVCLALELLRAQQ